MVQATFLMTMVVHLTACRTFGPEAIQSSQLDYNKSLSNGVQQELLLNIVRLRVQGVTVFSESREFDHEFQNKCQLRIEWGPESGGRQRFTFPFNWLWILACAPQWFTPRFRGRTLSEI